jgi:hypothetical protein
MLIRHFGLQWSRDEVEWSPGSGRRWYLLGYQGARADTLRVADVRTQQGLYVLYNDHGAYYVGLTKKQGIGKRLKDHTTDEHSKNWNRFSWFGFCLARKRVDESGLVTFRKLANTAAGSPQHVITDMEALLIRSHGLHSNRRQSGFTSAECWEQAKHSEMDWFEERLGWT